MLNPIEPVIDHIVQSFRPKPIKCWINEKLYLIEKIASGWCWRNEDGDLHEDFGFSPFETAAEAQQSAIGHVKRQLLMALYLRRTEIWKSQPRINLAASFAEKRAYLEHEAKWLADMREIDGLIAVARKGLV
jgi:hypothetical protein